MNQSSIKIDDNAYRINESIYVYSKAPEGGYFLSNDHLDYFGRPIRYNIKRINKGSDGHITLALEITGNNIRNPKYPRKTVINVTIDEKTTIRKVKYLTDEITRLTDAPAGEYHVKAADL